MSPSSIRPRSNSPISHTPIALTGLANRALFADRLHQAVRHARRQSTMFAVLMLDLDGFKAVNDTFGHEVGDVALQTRRAALPGLHPDGDTLARIGGDEFAVLLPRVGGSAGGRAGGAAHDRRAGDAARLRHAFRRSRHQHRHRRLARARRRRSMPCWRQPTPRCTAPSAPARTSSAGPHGQSGATSCRHRRWPGVRRTRSASGDRRSAYAAG